MKEYCFTETPHGTYRLVVSSSILVCESTVYALDNLSCWGGIDKHFKESQHVSWEFSNSLPKEYVERFVRRSFFEPNLDMEYYD